MNEKLVFALHKSRLRRSEIRDGCSQESKETLVSVIGSAIALPQPNCCCVFWSSWLKQRKERAFRRISSHQMFHCMFFPTCSWLAGMLQCIPEGQVCNRPFHARINRQTEHTGCIVHKHPFCVCQQGQHKLLLFLWLLGLVLFCIEERKHGQNSRSSAIRPHFKSFHVAKVCIRPELPTV